MPQQDFTAKVSDWVAKTKGMVKAVRNDSFEKVVKIMQTPVAQGGNMPSPIINAKTGKSSTGFLRSSGQVGFNGKLPELVPHPGGTNYDWDEASVNLSIKDANLQDTLTFGWAAEYAICQEYGTMYFEGRRFVALACQQWPQIVEQQCKLAEARYK